MRSTLDRPSLLVGLLVGALGTVLAATGSSVSSLWGDEVTTSMSARRSWASLAAMSHHVDAVHTTYYAVMHLWVGAFGVSAVSLRFPSALAVGVAVAGVVAVVRFGGGSLRLATIAAVLTAVLPRMTYAGEEARSFALTAAIATWLVAVALGTLRGRIARWAGWWTVAGLTVLGAYVFLYTLLLVPVVAVVVIGTARYRRVHVRAWFWTTLAAGAASVPIIAAGWLERSQISYLETSVTTDPRSLLVGMWFTSTGPAVLWWLLVVVALAAVAVRRLRSVPWLPGSASAADSSAFWLVVLWASLPTVLLVAAQTVFHGFSGRYMTFTAPAVAILAASGVEVLAVTAGRLLRGRRVPELAPAPVLAPVLSGVLVLVVAGVTAGTYLGQRTPYAKNGSDWAQVAEVVGTRAHTGDDVLFDETAKLSHRPRLAMRGYPDAFTGLRDVALTVPYWRNTTWHDTAMTISQAVAAGRVRADVVWVVQYDADASGGTEGSAALHGLGYRVVGRWTLNTDTVLEFRRR